MEWTQVLTIVGANLVLTAGCIGTTVTLFLWARSEAREDKKQTDAILQAIAEEMKDFHGRLCAIEERRKTCND